MLDKNQIAEAGNLLKQSKSIIVLLPQNPSVDSVAAALGLYLSLKAAKKAVQIGCFTPLNVSFNRLFGIDKIATKVGSRNLVISLPNVKESIDEVSTSVEGQNFNIIVSPQKGAVPIDSNKVSFSYAGIEVEAIFVIGARQLEDMGNLYNENRNVFTNAQLVAISNYGDTSAFGTTNLIDAQSSSCGEIVAKLLRSGGFSAREDIATNLLAGIESATNNLSFKTSADTFESMAWLMRQGGKRNHLLSSPTAMAAPGMIPGAGTRGVSQQPTPPTSPTQVVPPPIKTGITSPSTLVTQPSVAVPFQNAQSVAPPSAKQPPIAKETEATDKPQEGISSGEGGSEVKPSPDWYQPKIYRGKTTI